MPPARWSARLTCTARRSVSKTRSALSSRKRSAEASSLRPPAAFLQGGGRAGKGGKAVRRRKWRRGVAAQHAWKREEGCPRQYPLQRTWLPRRHRRPPAAPPAAPRCTPPAGMSLPVQWLHRAWLGGDLGRGRAGGSEQLGYKHAGLSRVAHAGGNPQNSHKCHNFAPEAISLRASATSPSSCRRCSACRCSAAASSS